MLIELGVVEQRHKAVLEVMGGLPVTEVAASCGVTRQTVHRWLRWYARGGIAALADGSHRPATCPHRMAPEVEARIVALRSEHPGWGRGPCSTTWGARDSPRSPAAPRSTAAFSATA